MTDALTTCVALPAGNVPLAVVPVLYGPLQVLLAVLPGILLALAATVLGFFSRQVLRAIGRVLWRHKFYALGLAGAGVGCLYLVSLVLSACGGAPAVSSAGGGGEWPAFRGGPERRGAAPGSPDPTSGGVVWAFASEAKPFYSSPAVAGRRIYVASADKKVFSDRGAIYCLDAATGGVIWKFGPSDFRATFSSPAVSGGYVVCGEGLHFVRDGRITCLDAETGRLVWQLRTQSHVESSPCIYNGKAYIGAGDDGLYAVALQPEADGRPRIVWHLDGKQYPDCEAAPIACDGKVYFALGEQGCGVVCVDAETGREVWRRPTPWPVFGSPTIAAGKLFVGMGIGNYVENAGDLLAKKLEALAKEGAGPDAVAEAKKRLAPGGAVWGIDLASGQVLCQVPMKDTVLGAPAAADGRLYFASRDGTCYAIDTDGKVLQQWSAREPIIAAAAVGQDHVYFVTESGRLYGLDRQTLRPVWEAQADTGGPCLSSPAVAGGHVYVGSSASGLVCLGQPGRRAEPLWAGHLGGPGRSGWADGSAPPPEAEMAWQYPRPTGDEASSAGVAPVSPAWLGGLYVGLCGKDRTGLARLSLGRTSGTRPRESWFCPTTNAPGKSPAIGGDRVYLVDGRPGDRQRRLHCLDAAGGKPIWQAEVTDDAPGDLLLTESALFACDAADTITCRRPAAEKAATWSRQVPGLVGAPALAGGWLLAASSREGLVALDAGTGEPRWRRALPARAVTGPVATDDVVAVGTEEGVTALSLVDGSPLWTARCGPCRGVLVCDDDRLACTTAAGELVLLNWRGAAVLRRPGVREDFPPMLCGREALCVTARGVDRIDLESGKSSPVAEAEWLKEAAAAPILVKSHLYVITEKMGLVCLAPKE